MKKVKGLLVTFDKYIDEHTADKIADAIMQINHVINVQPEHVNEKNYHEKQQIKFALMNRLLKVAQDFDI
jgi:hypothetical protein